MNFDAAISTPQNFRYLKILCENKEYSLKELCRKLELNYDTVYKRIKKYGWSLEKALNGKACQWILDNTKENK
jgi:DNA-binding ferritin-like protein (Dps family)